MQPLMEVEMQMDVALDVDVDADEHWETVLGGKPFEAALLLRLLSICDFYAIFVALSDITMPIGFEVPYTSWSL